MLFWWGFEEPWLTEGTEIIITLLLPWPKKKYVLYIFFLHSCRIMVSKAVISLLRCCVISFGLSRPNEEITDCFNFFSLCIIISHDCYYTDDSLEQEAIIFFQRKCFDVRHFICLCVVQDRVQDGKSRVESVCRKHPSLRRGVSARVHGQVLQLLLLCGEFIQLTWWFTR